jgi:hypothetical protein
MAAPSSIPAPARSIRTNLGACPLRFSSDALSVFLPGVNKTRYPNADITNREQSSFILFAGKLRGQCSLPFYSLEL